MAQTVYVIGHKNPDTDSVCAAIAYAHFKKKIDCDDDYKPAVTGPINSETKFILDYFKMETPEILTDASGKKIILVDHNEMGQVIDGIENAEIFEIIDHHRIGDIQTGAPILFHAEPIGSTSTIVADFFLYHKIEMPKEIAGILLAAILSDTVIFKSQTCTEKDKRIAMELARITGLNPEEFGLQVKKAKSDIKGKSANELIMSDFKEYRKEGTRYGVAQIEGVDYEEVGARKGELIKELDAVRESQGLNFALLMVTNIIEEGTRLWVVGDGEIAGKAFGKEVTDHEIHLPGVMSRKKQVVPEIEKVI